MGLTNLAVDNLRVNRDDDLTVEEHLNNIDYSDEGNADYVPSDFALAFVTFIKLVNGGEGEENKTPLIHYKMLDTFVSGEQRIINLLFRGAAKTTINEYLILYLAVYNELPGFGLVPLGVYVSDSIENGVKNMRKNLEYRRENSDFLMHYLPTVKFTDIRWEFKNIAGVTTLFKGYGASTGIRGTKELGQRPYLALMDDLISDDDARSPTIIASIESTVYKALEYALHTDRSLRIWSGTPFNAGDPLYKAVESGAWTVNAFPVCEQFPCTREEFRGAWPDRFTFDYVKGQYDSAMKSGKIADFNQELMLRIMSEEDRVIKDNDIRWYTLPTLMANKHKFNFYITTDFATGEEKGSDFSVINVWAYNNKGDWFWVDGVCRRQLMDKNIDDLFRLAQKWNPQSVGVEVSGQQGGFIPWLQNEMVDRNIWFNLASEHNNNKPGIRPVKNKLARFDNVIPWFKAGKFYFPKEKKDTPELLEMYNELSLVSPVKIKSKHDDFIDTISMLFSLNAWKPSEIALPENKGSNSIWELEEDIFDVDDGLSSYIV